MFIIDFENIYAGYDDGDVLKAVDLKIKEGENWAILGSNGSGKSTLLKLIMSELHPRRSHKHKKEVFSKSRYSIFELKEKLGIITNDLHNYFLHSGGHLSAYDVVLSGYYSSIGTFKHQSFCEEQQKKVLETLKELEILHLKDKKVSQMSTGELRRCIIARALIHNPKAFILDEPTVGLDIKAQINFIKLLRKLSKNHSIILVTHHIEEIFDEISHIALIYNNTIYKSGLKEEILTSENISKTFGVDLVINEKNGRFYIEEIF
ncbi:MAG: ATP-binding cassette domain-containing protein [Sulfurimonas sp.]|uniref:ABC transporter ATP-binding protein n=1 Tax=Sulfurimonas sp. TaxID=2022749 RepID=UPI0025D414BA|nr:ATP-binding cassette domain-containing protein [Sulfurimonas sp.]MCK9491695.1 ATP-binding cassette domain-containing protein [Sulfurimonas sp.]